MTSKPWMPLHIADYLDSTTDLRLEETGCYLLLLMIAWRRNGPLPNNFSNLKRTLGTCASNVEQMHGHTFNTLARKILKRFFYLDSNGDWRNERMEKELAKSAIYSSNQSQRSRKRWGVSSKINGIADATAMLLHNNTYIKTGGRKKKMSELDEKLKVSTDKFYAAFASAQLEAWNGYERTVKKTTPRDADGGWWFPSEWPPTVN